MRCLALVACLLSLAACSMGGRSTANQLMQELREAYPDQITSMEYESTFLDPPALHIETNIGAGEW